MNTYSLQYLNTWFKSNKDLKRYLEKKLGIVLPDTRQRDVTTNYLLRVARQEVFTISEKLYRHYREPLKTHHTKAELVNEVRQMQEKELGFAEKELPDKAWLIDAIYSLKPDHRIFDDPKEEIKREFPKE